MRITVEGIYRNGKVELKEQPDSIQESEVLVTFLAPVRKSVQPKAMLRYGQFAGGRRATDDDFRAAEWHGEDEFADGK